MSSLSAASTSMELFPITAQSQMRNFYQDFSENRFVFSGLEKTNMDLPYYYGSYLIETGKPNFGEKINLTKSSSSLPISEKLQTIKEEKICGKRQYSHIEGEDIIPFIHLPPLTASPISSHTPHTPPSSPFFISNKHKSRIQTSSSTNTDFSNLRTSDPHPSSPFPFELSMSLSSSPPSSPQTKSPLFTPSSPPSISSSTPTWWRSNTTHAHSDLSGHYFCVCNPKEKLAKTYNKGKCSKCQHNLKWWCDICQKSMWWNGRTAHRSSNAHIAGYKAITKSK